MRELPPRASYDSRSTPNTSMYLTDATNAAPRTVKYAGRIANRDSHSPPHGVIASQTNHHRRAHMGQ